ncbi:MAG: 4Fe-4S binding protein [Acutalibacter sp.]
MKLDKDKCVSCGKCLKACPMQVDMLDASRSRRNGTECILCLECIRECPKQALHL